MSDVPNPYAAGQAPQEIVPPPSRPPGQIRVLAILHLVFAGLGLVGLVIGIASQAFSDSILKSGAGTHPDAQFEVQKAITEAGRSHQYLGYGFSALLSVLLIIAGLALLKNKRFGLKVSNVYAWISIASKVGLAVLFFKTVLPAANTAIEGMLGGSKTDQTVVSIAKVTMVASGVLTPLLSCIYPILVLVLLNREGVRRSLH